MVSSKPAGRAMSTTALRASRVKVPADPGDRGISLVR